MINIMNPLWKVSVFAKIARLLKITHLINPIFFFSVSCDKFKLISHQVAFIPHPNVPPHTPHSPHTPHTPLACYSCVCWCVWQFWWQPEWSMCSFLFSTAGQVNHRGFSEILVTYEGFHIRKILDPEHTILWRGFSNIRVPEHTILYAYMRITSFLSVTD